MSKEGSRVDRYPQPVWTLCPEAEALKTEADAGLAAPLGGHLFVAFLLGG